jgi:hypothetical protein
MNKPYQVTSSVDAASFRVFFEAITNRDREIMNEKVADIELLCAEFRSEALSEAVSEFLAQHSTPGDETCCQVVPLKRGNRALVDENTTLAVQIAELKDEIGQLKELHR